MAIGYTPQTWVNGSAPALSAANLQTMDNGINSACDALDTPATMAPIVATAIEAGTSTATPNDTDKLTGVKADHSLLYYTWANIKAALKTYFDTLYSDLAHQARHRIGGADALPAASTSTAGLATLAASGGTTAGTCVQGNDARLASSGTFDPVISVASGSCGTNGTYSKGRYMLHATDWVSVRVTVASMATISSPSGVLTITGLPFPAHADAYPWSTLTIMQGSSALANMTGYHLIAQINPGESVITIKKCKDGTIADAGNIFDTSSGRALIIAGFYRKA